MKNEKYITKHSKGSYQVQIWLNGTPHYVGLFPTIEEATIKRDEFLKGKTNTSRTNESHYADNREMMRELIISKAAGQLSPKLLTICMKIVKNVGKKFRYKEEEDRFDCECYCYEMIIKNWHHFDLDRYDNPFAYYSEIIKRGFAMQFKILQKSRINTLSYDNVNEDGRGLHNYI